MCLINKRNTDVYVFFIHCFTYVFFDICDQLRLKHVFLFSKQNTYKINFDISKYCNIIALRYYIYSII